MQQERKTGRLERLFIACFRPSRYEELLTVKTVRHVLYVCLIVFFQVLIETVIPFTAWNISVGGFNNLILKRFPDFTIEDGEMKIESPIEFEINGVIRIKADSGTDQYEQKDLDENYQEEFLFGRDNLLVKMAGRVMDIPIKDFTSTKIDNQSLADAIPLIRVFVGIYFVSTYLVKGILYMLAVVFFAFLCRAAIRTPDGRFVNWKGTVIIAVYARTLFALIQSVNLCLGCPMGETLMLVLGTFGTMAFIDRAEAAVLKITVGK